MTKEKKAAQGIIELSMKNLFCAFIRNYGGLELADIYYGTHWTNRILGYFENLGRLMGYYVYYEWDKCDLTWFKNYDNPSDEERPVLHVESENDYTRVLVELLEKVENSDANNIVTIAYPETEADIVSFDTDVQQHINSLGRVVTVLAIQDGYHYSPSKEIRAHILRSNSPPQLNLVADRFMMQNRDEGEGTYYAKMKTL